MTVDIRPITLGLNTCYIVKGEGTIMLDGGMPNKVNEFLNALKRISLEPEDIQLILLTHGHFDHVGSARDIKEMTGSKIAMHALDRDGLEKSSLYVPPGVNVWASFVRSLIVGLVAPFLTVPTAKVDIVLGDEGLPLADYGIPGRVIHTPGHTEGSVSVLLNSGEAFVGDLAMNKFPMRLGPGLTVLAYDLEEVKASLRSLLDQGARTIYPGHGKPFSADIIKRQLEKMG